MPVTKSMRECYEVREGHEWANITLHCWDRRANVGTQRARRAGPSAAGHQQDAVPPGVAAD